ncbi:MAG: hypothetical protein N0C84_00625 [Candidatus Thiodiazotropha taylori]|uniref:Uncharacterized protein n=1 Tax=Candidatus Thiodiazotropha taylori TaxID=2792791 RepID=A0A9E4N344_9GAMM|nr:hypothetical protein [Candidatus Thiodiazotropha taylori]MCW4254949.1 hypothetical protein [Candidatus Thiodiazotropha taylori]
MARKSGMSEMALARMVVAYLSEAKGTMLTEAAKDPQYEEGAHYVELLADALIEKIRVGKDLGFKTRDLGL